MSVTNYGELKSIVAQLGQRSDLTALIPQFIASAELMIAEKVRAPELLVSATLDETDRVSGGVYTLPSDYLGMRQVWRSDGCPIDPVSLNRLRTWPVGAPAFKYATYGFSIEFRGAPSTDEEVSILYYARPAAFAADGDTNALLRNHHMLYVHAALSWLHTHTQDLELAQSHKSAFLAAVSDVNDLNTEQIGGAPTQSPVTLTSRSSM